VKRKKQNWDGVKWTPFELAPNQTGGDYLGHKKPDLIVMNSIYQVSVYVERFPDPFGEGAHLSIKTHDKAARHDWRDLQRIKNELCGPEHDAMEIYPAESKLVDAANQYHLFVFKDFKFPFGFQTRLVSDGTWRGSKQRPFMERPADCLDSQQYEELYARLEHQHFVLQQTKRK